MHPDLGLTLQKIQSNRIVEMDLAEVQTLAVCMCVVCFNSVCVSVSVSNTQHTTTVFSRHETPTALELTIRQTRDVPAANFYSPSNKLTVESPCGQTFSRHIVKSDLERQIDQVIFLPVKLAK